MTSRSWRTTICKFLVVRCIICNSRPPVVITSSKIQYSLFLATFPAHIFFATSRETMEPPTPHYQGDGDVDFYCGTHILPTGYWGWRLVSQKELIVIFFTNLPALCIRNPIPSQHQSILSYAIMDVPILDILSRICYRILARWADLHCIKVLRQLGRHLTCLSRYLYGSEYYFRCLGPSRKRRCACRCPW